jgi:hypothetical protein
MVERLMMYEIGKPIIPGWDAMTLAQRDEARHRQYEQFIARTPNGETEGRDPRKIPREELATLAEPMPVLKAIRMKCLDCCCYQISEVARCTAVNCPLWPFRMGTNPWRAPVSEERRAAMAARMVSGSGKPLNHGEEIEEAEPEVPGPVALPDPAIPMAGATGPAMA